MAKAKTIREIAADFAAKANHKNSEAKREFEILYDLIIKELKANGEFNLFGLGKLKVSKSKERKGINPQTHKPMIIKPKTRVKFRASKALKEAVIRK